MDRKENKGGFITNKELEEDLKAKGRTGQKTRYFGSQDTGDNVVRHLGTDVQKSDGLGEEEKEKE